MVALIALVSACSGDSSGGTTTTNVPPETTSTSIPDSTTTASPGTDWERPPVCDCEPEVVASIPVGESGVTYLHLDTPEAQPVGPGALAIDDRGRFVVLDTGGLGIVVATEAGVEKMTLEWDRIQSLIDIVIVDDGYLILELPFGSDQARIVEVAADATIGNLYDLPQGLWLGDGLTGFRLGPNDETWIELELGNRVADIDLSTLEFAITEGFPYPDGLYVIKTWMEPTTLFQAGDTTVEIENQSGGVMTSYMIGKNPDGSFVLGANELTEDSEGLHVTDHALWFDAEGNLLARVDIPVGDQLIYVQHPTVLGADGNLYYLLTTRDDVQVLKLGWQSAG